MRKNRIKLNEAQLHRVIKESVRNVLNEFYQPWQYDGEYHGPSEDEIEQDKKENFEDDDNIEIGYYNYYNSIIPEYIEDEICADYNLHRAPYSHSRQIIYLKGGDESIADSINKEYWNVRASYNRECRHICLTPITKKESRKLEWEKLPKTPKKFSYIPYVPELHDNFLWDDDKRWGAKAYSKMNKFLNPDTDELEDFK